MASGDTSENPDSFFKCIQRAHEILTDPVKRRQFDSVDEEADVTPPTKKESEKMSQKEFFKTWSEVFDSEARFSNRQPAAKLGNEKSSEDAVKSFYDFWYSFDSWRSFEYLDEDIPDDNEARDHRRHVEKKNANQRRKKKTADTARLRKLVEDCERGDLRLKKFRQEAAAGKNKKRLDREAAAKKEAEEKQKAKEAEETRLKAAEEAAKVQREADKRTKEAAKNAVKKNKRVVKGSVKDVNYFAPAGGEASAEQINAVLDDTDKILAKIDPDELADLVGRLNLAGKDGDKVMATFVGEQQRLVDDGKLGGADCKVFKTT